MESTFCSQCNALGSSDENFVPKTDEAKRNHAQTHFVQLKTLDDKIMEDKIFRQCFTIRQPKAERMELSRIKCRKSLLGLCKTLLKDQPKNTRAVCNMCEAGISYLKGKKYGIMIQHACAHSEAKLYVCRLCEHSANNSRTILFHAQRVHNICKPTTEHFEDKIAEHFNMVSNLIERCFSTNFPRASMLQRQFSIRSNSRDKNQREIVHFCRSIFIERSKPASLECNFCGLRVVVRQQGHGYDGSAMYRHAAAHLDVKLFTCRHCGSSLSSIFTMRIHLRNVHQILDGNSDDIHDQSEKFHSEYLNMIKRCFAADQGKLEALSTINKSTRAEAAIRNRTTGSKFAVERHLFYNRLIRRIVDSDGKIKCSLCSARLAVNFSGGTISQFALFHAEAHLEKPLYRCKVCMSSFCTQSTVVYHLKSKHALGMGKNYECVADEFHDEIMAMLSKCYAPEDS